MLHATEGEIERMGLVNSKALEQLESVLRSLDSMGRDRALEVACGECHVTRHVLLNYFAKVDLMDRAQDAVE